MFSGQGHTSTREPAGRSAMHSSVIEISCSEVHAKNAGGTPMISAPRFISPKTPRAMAPLIPTSSTAGGDGQRRFRVGRGVVVVDHHGGTGQGGLQGAELDGCHGDLAVHVERVGEHEVSQPRNEAHPVTEATSQ